MNKATGGKPLYLAKTNRILKSKFMMMIESGSIGNPRSHRIHAPNPQYENTLYHSILLILKITDDGPTMIWRLFE